MATVSSAPRVNEITLASDSAGPFEVGFRLFEADALEIYVNEVRQTTGYTITASFSDGYDDDATLSFTTALSSGDVILILGNMAPARGEDYLPGDGLLSNKLNIELARMWAALSETRSLAMRSARILSSEDFGYLPATPNNLIGIGEDGAPALYPAVTEVLEEAIFLSFSTRAAAESVDANTATRKYILVEGLIYAYEEGATDLVTGDGRTWKLADRLFFATYDDLLADTRSWFWEGLPLYIGTHGVAVVAADDATDHVGTTAGGVKVYTIGISDTESSGFYRGAGSKVNFLRWRGRVFGADSYSFAGYASTSVDALGVTRNYRTGSFLNASSENAPAGYPTETTSGATTHLDEGTNLFAVNGDVVVLASSIDATTATTTLPIVDASALPNSGVIRCGSELIYYTGKSGNTLTGVVRGFNPVNQTQGTAVGIYTTLASGITSVATTIPLADASVYPTSGTITIGSETITYTGKSGNDLTGATRGAGGTTAAAHSSGAEVRADPVADANLVTAHAGGTAYTTGSLASAIDNSVTTIPLVNASSFAFSGTVRIGSELISYTGKSGNNLTGATRGGSAVSHGAGASVVQGDRAYLVFIGTRLRGYEANAQMVWSTDRGGFAIVGAAQTTSSQPGIGVSGIVRLAFSGSTNGWGGYFEAVRGDKVAGGGLWAIEASAVNYRISPTTQKVNPYSDGYAGHNKVFMANAGADETNVFDIDVFYHARGHYYLDESDPAYDGKPKGARAMALLVSPDKGLRETSSDGGTSAATKKSFMLGSMHAITGSDPTADSNNPRIGQELFYNHLTGAWTSNRTNPPGSTPMLWDYRVSGTSQLALAARSGGGVSWNTAGVTLSLGSRAALVTYWASHSGKHAAGDRLSDGELGYFVMPAGHVAYGSDPISALPGLAPVPEWIDARHFGDIGNGVMADDTAAIQAAIDYVNLTSGGVVNIPSGTFIIDGAKGDAETYNANLGGGLRLLSGVTLRGRGPSLTSLQNGADEWRSVIGIRDPRDFGIEDMTIDGQWPTYDPHPTDPKRGECIITWNDADPLVNGSLKRLVLKNSAHYLLGLQNVSQEGLQVESIVGENAGGDGIDIKSFTQILSTAVTEDRMTSIKHIWIKSFMQNPDHDDQAGVDIRGTVHADHIFVEQTWDLKTGQTAKTGIRMNAPVTASSRLGAARSKLGYHVVTSTKPAGNGNTTDEFITGVEVNDSYVNLSPGVVEDQFYGYRFTANQDGVPVGVQGTGLTAIRCKGTSGDGRAFDFGADADHCNIQGFADDCDYGWDSGGTYNHLSGSARNCLVGLSYDSDTAFPHSLVFEGCTTDVQDRSGGYAETGNIVPRIQAIIGPRQVYQDIVSTADDSGWTGDDAILGGVRFYKYDQTGGNMGLFGEMTMRATGSTGGNFAMWFAVQDAAGTMVDVLELQYGRIRAKVPVESPVYTVATLPSGVSAGATAYASNGRKSGEGAGAGTGVPVYWGGAAWLTYYDNTTVQA